ncbi:hypothetical protein OS493_035260 [Desmophyllum pertusum]|uniref:Uncharacterized protein n=1 Tax=Desmophyllum pertusum TaxID=174260 RepID=A0A9W9ZIN9_9CNID|nr:hypothetical protein OS493_035260 [Desmophyllum pertusum]
MRVILNEKNKWGGKIESKWDNYKDAKAREEELFALCATTSKRDDSSEVSSKSQRKAALAGRDFLKRVTSSDDADMNSSQEIVMMTQCPLMKKSDNGIEHDLEFEKEEYLEKLKEKNKKSRAKKQKKAAKMRAIKQFCLFEGNNLVKKVAQQEAVSSFVELTAFQPVGNTTSQPETDSSEAGTSSTQNSSDPFKTASGS